MDLSSAAESLIRAGQRLHAGGYCPATSGNYSLRLDAARVLVTASGRHKGHLRSGDFVVIHADGSPESGGAPSAETPLHALMFRIDPTIGAVLHTHSVASTVLTLALAGAESLELQGYEMLKAIPGVASHTTRVELPIFENSQDIPALANEVEARWRRRPFPGYLLRGHGLYSWAADLDTALRSVEGLEFLLACELERRKIR
jgi:methylthioribulose-1-phosphate dehydratase